MTSQILKSVDFTKAQKFRYLEKEAFFHQVIKFINYTSRAILLQKKKFVAEVTLIFFSFIKVLKGKKEKLELTSFYFSVKKHDSMIHENLFT